VPLASSSEGAVEATEAATVVDAATVAIAAAMAAAATAVAATAVTEEEAATDITTARTCSHGYSFDRIDKFCEIRNKKVSFLNKMLVLLVFSTVNSY
jgi:hypothetical protein